MKNRFGSIEVPHPTDSSDKKEGVHLNCPACGHKYPLTANFCPNCGGDLRRLTKTRPSTHRGLGEGTETHPPKKKSVSPALSTEEYINRKKEIHHELRYRAIYIIVFFLLLLLLFLKPAWFRFL